MKAITPMKTTMKIWIGSVLLVASGVLLNAASPAFHAVTPEGWSIIKGQAEEGNLLQAKGKIPLEIQTTASLPVPVEATVRFRAAVGDTIAVRAVTEEQNAKPLLECQFTLQSDNHATVIALSSGAPMATVINSALRADYRDKKTGQLGWFSGYSWRFPKVKNLWDERDYKEIGAANAQLVPFEDKVFTLRLTLTATTRQIWLDDRLVAEEQVANSQPVRLVVQLAKTTKVLAADFSAPVDTGRFLPLALEDYSHLKRAQAVPVSCALTTLQSVAMRVPKTGSPDINLGDSIYRYRLTHGSGPNTGYVNEQCSWLNAFRIDPAQLTFRVPYRNYQNVWLLAWVDDQKDTVAKGTLQFYKEDGGYPAGSDLEISEAAIKQGLVTKLAQKTADGKQLYLVKVPVDTIGLYGMRDQADQFMEFELSKPVALMRSYPDPIYYGYHPAGLPSSIHVVGITLEEAPFGFQVEPKQTHFVFESPEKPSVTVSVTNTTAKALDAEVRVESGSYDGEEKHVVKGRATIAPGKSGDVELTFELQKFGWHELKFAVAAGGVQRAATLSLVLLPRNTRTYGNAVNENRFGMWGLVGHYVSVKDGADAANQLFMEAYRKLGLVNFVTFHTTWRNIAKYTLENNDLEALKKGAEAEAAGVMKRAKEHSTPTPLYFYGGEWGIGNQALGYGPWPLYTGEGDLPLPEEVRKTVEFQIKVFTAIGKTIREECPQTKLLLNWGEPAECVAHLRLGMPKDVVDGFGMDAPMFELLPEVSNALGSINKLWTLRAEAKRLGWPRLPIGWTEGPFFPTCPGALTVRDQMDYQVRYLLLGFAYGVDYFASGIVPQDAGNYYGAEHYGAGIFNRVPLENPKPAVAAVATMTSMLCGADPVGGIDTGCLTTYCLEFQRAKDKAKIYALWRVNGKVNARVKVRGSQAVVTDAMGNAAQTAIKDGAIQVTLSSSPVWLTGVEKVEGFEFEKPVYDSAPAMVTRPLAEMTADKWNYDGAEDKVYAQNHFAVHRITDANLKAEFDQGEESHTNAIAITLPVEPGDRPLANRYGALKLKKPVVIPGKAAALGVWIKGNSSWGRVIYQLRDAKGQIWTSVGTKEDWNCDDTHAWSYVNFDGWRYVRFPLPGNHPWDSARDLETTWWGSRGGDGIVNLPLTLEKIIVEARNEVPVLGEMKLVPDRSYKLAGLVAEYDSEDDATSLAITQRQIRMPIPTWTGPTDNPIARLAAEGVGTAPEIKGFEEPQHFNDGRQMHIRFAQDPALKYNLYLTRYPDGHGADLILAGIKDDQLVGGLRPELTMYLFLTSVSADKKESKPSKAFQLITHDKFLEK